MYIEAGARIYYDKQTGISILNTTHRTYNGNFNPVDVIGSVDDDFIKYNVLAQRVRETVGVIELAYGQYEQDFAECNGYQVDVSGAEPTIVFSYPDPNVPPTPPVYQKPLTVQIAEAKDTIDQMSVENQNFMDYYFSKNPETPVV